MSDKVFISCSSADNQIAKAICTGLEKRGLPCWLASRDVRPGEDFQAAIVRAIRAARVMVLVFSQNANNSDEIKKELVLASQNNVVIIPARVENVAPNDSLAYQFATRQWVDLFENWENEIERLGSWISRIVGGETAQMTPSGAPSGLTRGATSASSPMPVLQQNALLINPLYHFVGTIMLIIGIFFAIKLGPEFAGRSVATACLCHPSDNASFYEGCAQPWLDRLTGKCSTYHSWFISTYYWFILPVVSAVIAALIFTGLGSLWRKAWARFVGMGLCVAGFTLAAYLILGVSADDDASEGFVSWLGVFDFGKFFSWLEVFVFAVCAAVYILGWKERLGPQSARYIGPLRRSSVFAATILVLCALTVGSFHSFYFGATVTYGALAWTAVLVALDGFVFVWSFIWFRRKFGQTSWSARPIRP
jgi:hypothetical protein